MDASLPTWFRKSSSVTVKQESSAHQQQHLMAPPPVAVPPVKKVVVGKKSSAASISRVHGIPEGTLDSLSTYDKQDKSMADKTTRIAVLGDRLERSRNKVDTYKEGDAPDVIDDSLLSDGVGKTARVYQHHAAYVGEIRVEEGDDDERKKQLAKKRDREEEEGADVEEEEEEDADAEVDPVDIDNTPLYTTESAASKALLAAIPSRVPDMAEVPVIKTYKEYSSRRPASGQFERNMRHIAGPEQGMFVSVREENAVYKDVSSLLEDPFRSQQLSRYAITRGMAIPNPPTISKERIRDGLCSPNYEIGERPCVNGVKCASYLMGVARKKRDPNKYAFVEPFMCKEFYFGPQGEAMRVAMAEGVSLKEFYSRELKLCVMCHLAIVTSHYKSYDLNLVTDPPHVLNAFCVNYNVIGEYPLDCLLMGDDKWKGVVGPYIRHVPDNYEWEPVAPETIRVEGAFDPLTGQPVYEQRQRPQKWVERETLDFH